MSPSTSKVVVFVAVLLLLIVVGVPFSIQHSIPAQAHINAAHREDRHARPLSQILLPISAINDSPTTLSATTTFTATVDGDATGFTYSWSFGDGGSAMGRVVKHTYTMTGIFEAFVVVSDKAGNTSQVPTTVIILAPPTPTPTPTPGLINDINISVSGSREVNSPTTLIAVAEGGGPYVTYEWNFGDGSSETGATVNHIFRAIQKYTVTVTARNGNSNSTISRSVEIDILEPAIRGLDFTVDGRPFWNVPTRFNPRIDSGGPNVQYEWFWGDGERSSSSVGQSPTHVYRARGAFNVQLVARNSRGEVRTNKQIQVLRPPPKDLIIADEGNPISAGQEFKLYAIVDDSEGVSYQWQFFDHDPGGTAFHAIATIRYSNSGVYPVVLTASTEGGTTTALRAILIDRLIHPQDLPLQPIPEFVVREESMQFAVESLKDIDKYNYSWEFSDQVILSGATIVRSFNTLKYYALYVTKTEKDNPNNILATHAAVFRVVGGVLYLPLLNNNSESRVATQPSVGATATSTATSTPTTTLTPTHAPTTTPTPTLTATPTRTDTATPIHTPTSTDTPLPTSTTNPGGSIPPTPSN